MFRSVVASSLGFVVAACTSTAGSSPAPTAPTPVPTSTSSSVTTTSSPPDATAAKPTGIAQHAFYGAFLGAGDVGERFQSLAEPDVARGLARRYRTGQKPEELWWVADATWSDPHSDESLRRIEETRWYFADEGAASRFVASVVSNLHEHTRSEDTEGPSVGSDCHLLKATIEETMGTMTHYIYVFRVARLVAELRFDQGPRARTSLTQDLVVPIARRAADRAAAAQATELAAAR